MSYFTEDAKKFRFPSLPDNGSKKKQAYVMGFAKAVAASQLSPGEKVAWLKYAAQQVPSQDPSAPGGPLPPQQDPGAPMDDGGGDPLAAEANGGAPGGDDEVAQQILQSLPGNSVEEKLHAAVMILAQMQGGDQAVLPGAGPGIEPGGMDPAAEAGEAAGGPGSGDPDGAGGIDPAVLQQLLSQMGGAGGPPPGPKGPPQK